MLNGKKFKKIVTLVLAISILVSSLSGLGIIASASDTAAKAMYYEVGVKDETDVVKPSATSNYGRMIFYFGGVEVGKKYVLSFDMKTTAGGSPFLFRWSANNGAQPNNDCVPNKVEGYRYYFNIDITSANSPNANGKLLFNMFMAEKSAGYISNFTLFEADSNFVPVQNASNLASVYGDFSSWTNNAEAGAPGFLNLIDLMKTASGRVDTVASDFFVRKEAKRMYYKATAEGEGRINLRLPSNSSASSDFCYILKFDLKTTVGEAPTKFWNQGSASNAAFVGVNGTKYTFNIKVPKIQGGYANVFSMFFPAGSEGYISNIEMYQTDSSFKKANAYNQAIAYDNFSVWTKDAQTNTKYVGSLELAANMDSATGTLDSIPDGFFVAPTITKEPQAMYYEVGANGDTDVVDGSKYRGRMIFNIGGVSNSDKHYVLSFDMKATKGGVPWIFQWSANSGSKNNSIVPAKVEGNKYTFNISVNGTTASNCNGILLFNMYFAEKSAGYVSNFEMYEADSDFKVTGTENLADTFGDFKNWSKEAYTSGGGKLSLNDLMKTVSGRVDEVSEDFFTVLDAKRMYYKTTSDGEGRMSFRFPTDSSASSNFCYKLSFNLKNVSGDAPTKFWGHNGKAELVKKVEVEGTKYTINLEIPKIQNGYATDFSIFLPKDSEGYITNLEMYRCDSNFENPQVYNHAVAYGNFSVWTKDAQPDTKYVGSLNLIQNMDSETGKLSSIPNGFFDATAGNEKPKAMYFEVGKQGETDLIKSNASSYYGRMIFYFGGVEVGKKYVLSFDMKTTAGGPPFLFRWSANGGAQPNNDCLPNKVEGYRYYFNIDITSTNSPGANGKLLFNMYMAEKSAGYISNFTLYEADNDFKPVSNAVNLANEYGNFTNWSKDSAEAGAPGYLNLIDFMKTSSGRVDDVAVDYFEYKPAKMMKYKATSAGEGRLIFSMPSNSSAVRDFCYILTFDLRTTAGEAPTKFWGHNGVDANAELISVNGTKYTLQVKVPKIQVGYASQLSMFFPAGSEGYISNMKMYSCDEYFENLSAYNQAIAYDNFSVWTKDAQPDKKYVGSLNLVENMDEVTGTIEEIPSSDFFYLGGNDDDDDQEDVVAGEKRMIYYEGNDNDVQFHFSDVGAELKNYQLSFYIRDTSYTPEVKGEGLEDIVSGNRWYQFYILDDAGKKKYVIPTEIDGDKYSFDLEIKGELKFGIYLRKKNRGQSGYISDMKLYETDKNGKVIGTENKAAIYGDFSNWTRTMYAQGKPGSIKGKGKTGKLAEIPANYFVTAPEAVKEEKAAMILGTVKAGEFGQWVELDPNETYIFSAYFKRIVDTGTSMSITYNSGSGGTSRTGIPQADAPTVIDEDTFFCSREFKIPSDAHVFENGKVRVFVMFHEGGLGSLAYIYKPSLVKKSEPDKQLFTNADFSQGLYGWRTAGLDEGVVRGGEFAATVPTTVASDNSTKTGEIMILDYEDYFFKRDDNDSYFDDGNWADKIVTPGKLAGTLVDADENAISNATIILNGDTKLTVKTNANGEFLFKDIPLGKYELSVKLGKGDAIVFDEVIEIGNAASLEVALQYNKSVDSTIADKVIGTLTSPETWDNTMALSIVVLLNIISLAVLVFCVYRKKCK